jgi:hypothetical protein
MMESVHAQEPGADRAETTTAPAVAPSSAAGVIPLPLFVPRDNLIFYAEFDGLGAHAGAWQKTAAYKMLNSTPLGVMLEEIATQFLDRAMSQLPGRKFSGAEAFGLVKMMAQKGCVLALNASQNGPNPFVGTIVLRGGSTKQNKALSSRLLGLLMGPDPKPRIERQNGRVMVHVPRRSSPDSGWVWWPEREDLVIVFMQPSDAASIQSALDGRSPSAADHPIIKELARPEGSFTPLMRAMFDPGASPAALGMAAVGMPQPRLTAGMSQFRAATGIDRMEFRWGFDGDALQSTTRLVAPAPRKNILALFDQPPLRTGELIPMPDDTSAFVALSVSPSKVLEALGQTASAAEVKAKIDELAEKLWTQNKIDLEKNLLGNLGPKMVFYMAPGRLASVTDEGAGPSAGVAGLDPTAIFSSLQKAVAKPTLVAELKDPVIFGKALDALVLEVNKELKARAIEKAAEESAREPAAGAKDPSRHGLAQARGVARDPTSAGEGPWPVGRSPRRRSLRETPAPEFRLMPGQIKTYKLVVPSDSSWKIVPPGVRPTIQIEDKYVVFASTSDAAKGALETVRKKGWKPSADVENALARLPDRPMLVALVDSRESDSSLLASLPGTLQARINTLITMSAANAGNPGSAPGAITSASLPASSGPSGGPAGNPRMRRNRTSIRGEGGVGGGLPNGTPGFAGFSDAPGGAGSSSAGSQQNWIQLKVDPTHLPKAEDLKALMFPGTWAVVADEQSIRLVTRESFPNLYGSMSMGAVALSLALPAIQAARVRARGGPDVQAGGIAPGQLGPGSPGAGRGSFPAAAPEAPGAMTPAPAGATAGPGPFGRPGPGNREPW